MKQTENSQLNMKISGMERKSSGKRDSFLAQTKDAKENMKPPGKVCFYKIYLIELLKYMVLWEHIASNWKRKLLKAN